MTEFTQTQILVGSVAQRVEVTASEFIDVANLHPNCESTFYIAGDLAACTPALGRPLPPGHSFRWDVHRSNTGQHHFYIVAAEDFDDQHAAIAAR
jgi:hypothetical protein